MAENRTVARRSRNRKRAYAVAAAGTVLAAAVAVPSLAAWTDTEWIVGGVGNGSGGGTGGVGTSTFEVEQQASGDAAFADYETQAGANVIDFSAQAANLTLGATVYAWVNVKTKTDSLAGSLGIMAATDTAESELADALRYGAAIVTSTAACDAVGFAAGTSLQAAGAPLDQDGATSFDLLADGADTKTVCFQLTLPADAANTLQGQTATPLWYFAATSV